MRHSSPVVPLADVYETMHIMPPPIRLFQFQFHVCDGKLKVKPFLWAAIWTFYLRLKHKQRHCPALNSAHAVVLQINPSKLIVIFCVYGRS